MIPIINYLKTETLPTDEKEAKRLKREAQYYTIINNTLYKRGISIPFLKCVPTSNTREVLEEIHSGICGNHLGAYTSSHKKNTPDGILLANSTKGSYRVCKDMSTMPETCQLSHRPARRAHQRNLTLAICKMGTRSSRTLPSEIRTS